MNNVRVGDWVYTLYGWGKVTEINTSADYPLEITINQPNETHNIIDYFTLDGKTDLDHLYPSAWVNPPAYLNAPPIPVNPFKEGDEVVVWDSNDSPERFPRIYAFYDDIRNYHYCYSDGGTKWTSGGTTTQWNYCQRRAD